MYKPTITMMAMTKTSMHPSVSRVVLEGEYDSYSEEMSPLRFHQLTWVTKNEGT
jgi:hypothetical protein